MQPIDLSKLVTIVFQSFSTLAIAFAAYRYLRSLDERSAETLLRLEARFNELQRQWQAQPAGNFLPSITRAVDPEACEFKKTGLELAIDKGLKKQWATRTDLERAWMSRLDEFLRFLLLVVAMEKNQLLKNRALWDAYHYWFRAVARTQKLKDYVRKYFPTLDKFLENNEKTLRRYEQIP